MKNKLVMAALAAAMLCALSFGACKQDVQDVKFSLDKAEPVASVTAAKVTVDGNNDVIVRWSAVDDAGGYAVYLKYGDSKTVTQVAESYDVDPGKAYNADGTAAAPTSIDSWAFKVPGGWFSVTGSYTFGVRTEPFIDNDNTAESDIVWSNAVPITVPTP